MKKALKGWIPKVLAIALIVSAFGLQSNMAMAASLTSLSDNQSRLKASTASDHEIKFASPTGIAAAGTVTLTFASGFNLSTIVFGDVDFATGSTANCTTATYTEQALAAAPSGATWGVAVSGQVLTLTSGSGTSTAGNCVRFRIGLNAVTGVSGTHQITNPTAGSYTIVVGGTFGDTGTDAVVIISNDQVTVDATVDPSITFSISANAIHFGTLTAANARFADTSTGTTTSSTVAHTLAAGTNATSGYVMYLSGDILKSGANSITAAAGASSPGTSQFGLTLANVAASGGSGTATAPYATSSSYAFTATPSTQVQVASATGTTATTTYSATYLANITANQAAGAYSTTLTYTATATF